MKEVEVVFDFDPTERAPRIPISEDVVVIVVVVSYIGLDGSRRNGFSITYTEQWRKLVAISFDARRDYWGFRHRRAVPVDEVDGENH